MQDILFPEQLIVERFSKAMPSYADFDGLYKLAARHLLDRLEDTKKDFHEVLELGCGVQPLKDRLPPNLKPNAYTTIDICHTAQADYTLNCEKELPFDNPQFDLVLSNMMLPWNNDVRRVFLNAGRSLKGDGLLLMSGLGSESLPELKQAFLKAGSTMPHTNPLPDVRALGDLLTGLKFALPVVDRDMITVTYPSFGHLLADLKFTGSSNMHPQRNKGLTTPRFMQKVEEIYMNDFAVDGHIPVTFEVIYITAWRPHKSQQQPLKPGEGKIPLSEIFE